MPYRNKWEPNGLLRRFAGVLTGEDIFVANTELHSDNRFKAIKYIINDFSEVTDHAIKTDHTEVYALTDRMISRTKHSLKIALVVPQAELLPLAENYRELMKEELFECSIFKTVESARCWVND